MEDLLRRALDDYRAQFGHDFDSTWQPVSQKDLEDRLRSSQIDFNSWRSKHAKIYKSLSTIIFPITKVGKLVSSGISDAFPPAAAAAAGLVAIVEAAEKVSEAYDFVEQMFVKLEDVLCRWRIDFKHEVDAQLRSKMQQILLLLLSIISRSRRILKHGRARRYFDSLIFGKDQKTADLLQALEDLIQSEDRTRIALNLDKVTALWQKAVQIEDENVVERLSSPLVKTNAKVHANILEDKLAGTGQWFKQEPLYELWTQKKSPLLMLLGGPGSGKSYLAASLIEDLAQEYPIFNRKEGDPSFAYFYINRTTQEGLAAILKALAYQIQKTNQEYRRYVIETLNQTDLYTAKEVWAKLFLDFWNEQSNPGEEIILVIDGLNEAAVVDIETFAQELIRELVIQPGYNIRLAIFGRIQLWSDFEYIPRQGFVEIDSNKNNKDINAYIGQGVVKVRALRKSKETERLAIQERISECCDGVFEWARLLLAKCKNLEKSRMRKLLQEPPETLDDMIRSCFDQILDDDEIDPQVLRTLLLWLATEEDNELLWWNIVRKLSTIIRWKAARTSSGSDQDFAENHVEVLDEEKGWSLETSTTYLSFGNSRIRDYVLQQSELEADARPDARRWPPNPQQSECEIVKMGFKWLQNEEVEDLGIDNLPFYPLQFTFQHLATIDIDKVEDNDTLEIVAGLLWFFCEESAHQRIFQSDPNNEPDPVALFWSLWVKTSDNIRLVQAWFRKALRDKVEVDLSKEDWMLAASTSATTLFKPFMDFLCRSWLQFEWNYGCAYAVWDRTMKFAIRTLPVFDRITDDGKFPDYLRNWRELDQVTISPGDVITFARKSGFAPDARYHIGLSWAFAAMGKSGPALEYALKTPIEGDFAWVGAELRCRAYGGLQELDQALYWANLVGDLVPDLRGPMTFAACMWLLRKNEKKLALAKGLQTYESSDMLWFGDIVYLHCLAIEKEGGVLLEVMRALDQKSRDNVEYSNLTRTLIEENQVFRGKALQAIGHAYTFSRSAEDKQLIWDTIQRAQISIIQYEGEIKQIRWTNEMARFSGRYLEGGLKKSVNLLARNLVRTKESKLIPNELQRVELMLHTASQYASTLYMFAEEQEAAGDSDLGNTLQEMESLILKCEEIDKIPLLSSSITLSYYPGFYYGCWLRTRKCPEASWKKYFYRSLSDSLNMLDDMNPKNDLSGLMQCVVFLSLAGDLTDAIALRTLLLWQLDLAYEQALARGQIAEQRICGTGKGLEVADIVDEQITDLSHKILSTRLDKSSAIIEASANPDGDKDGTIELALDGDCPFSCFTCLVNNKFAKSMYLCETCLFEYCEKCKPTGPLHDFLGYRCGNHHKMRQVWPVSDDIRDLAAVRVGNRIHLKREWLQRVKERWREPVKAESDRV